MPNEPTDEEKKKALRNLLLAPIFVKRGYYYKTALDEHKANKDAIYDNENWFCYANNNSTLSSIGINYCIVSKQKYYSTKDADMSDISIHFYQSLYDLNSNENNDEGKILNDSRLSSKEFAGDTMNTPNDLVNRCNDEEEETLSKLDLLKLRYHCLANFWILPTEIGRSLGSLSKASCCKDYISLFLKKYCEEEKYNIDFKNKHGDYHAKFPKDSFIKYHYLPEQTVNTDVFKNIGSNLNTIIDSMNCFIDCRANTIVESKFQDLYLAFEPLCDSILREMKSRD